jgi:hypothetical protein
VNNIISFPDKQCVDRINRIPQLDSLCELNGASDLRVATEQLRDRMAVVTSALEMLKRTLGQD